MNHPHEAPSTVASSFHSMLLLNPHEEIVFSFDEDEDDKDN